jgi:hypothetical protein
LDKKKRTGKTLMTKLQTVTQKPTASHLGKQKHTEDSESDNGGNSSDGNNAVDKSIDNNNQLYEGSHFLDIS